MQFVQREHKQRSEPFPGLMKPEQKTQNLGISLVQHPKMVPPPPAPEPASAPASAPAPAPRKPRATKKPAVEPQPSEAPSESIPRATTAGKQKPRKLL